MKNRSEIRMPAGAGNILRCAFFFRGWRPAQRLDVDDIEDVKAAVSEACVLLMAGAGGRELRITVEGGDGLWAECAVEDMRKRLLTQMRRNVAYNSGSAGG